MSGARRVFLGPQFHQPTVGTVLSDLGVRGPVATITAGWQEWEGEDAALRRQVGPHALPIRLYARAERVWAEDPELREEHRKAQADLRIVRDLYNKQLEALAEAWLALLVDDAPAHLLAPEQQAALEAIQRLDERHLTRIEEIRAAFRDRVELECRPSVARQRAEVAARLGDAEAVVIEGGHAAVLRNRMSLFDVASMIADKTLLGCAAGAMVLCRRVVLYNDSPAIGRGHAEISLPGFDLAPGVVALPDASKRLRLDDADRMRRLALRVAPDACVLLDPGARLDWDGEAWTGTGGRVRDDGSTAGWGEAA